MILPGNGSCPGFLFQAFSAPDMPGIDVEGEMGGKPVAIIMGSQSDWTTMKHAADTLAELGIGYESLIVSAHRGRGGHGRRTERDESLARGHDRYSRWWPARPHAGARRRAARPAMPRLFSARRGFLRLPGRARLDLRFLRGPGRARAFCGTR